MKLTISLILLLVCLSTKAAVFDVTSYGAVGDLITNTVSTTSNSAVIISTSAVTLKTGAVIEVLGVGTVTTAPSCQDLITTVSSISGNNITLATVCKRTLASTTIYYGHNNSSSINTAYQAAESDSYVNHRTNTLYFPTGNYLCLSSGGSWYGLSGIQMTGGGVIFNGDGIGQTVLTGQGAWNLQGSDAWRGWLIEVIASTNDLSWGIQNMTLFGGIPQGNTSNHGFPASTIDGTGWDETHGSLTIWNDPNGGSVDNVVTFGTISNVLICGWRGEMLKSINHSTNGNLTLTNTFFGDGNATAINIYPSINMNHCTFSNLFQVGEYYQQYNTNVSYLQNCYITNILGNGFALNGGKGNNPYFIIISNLWFSEAGFNTVEFAPADNVQILGNNFLNVGYTVLGGCLDGSVGAQGTFCSSNILFAFNTISNGSQGLITGGTYPYQSVNISMVSNNFVGFPNGGVYPAYTEYPGATNITWSWNNFYNTAWQVTFNYVGGGSPYPLVETNNIYWSYLLTDAGGTVGVSYATGSRYLLTYNHLNGTYYYLVNSDSNQIPAGAQMYFTNGTFNHQSVTVYYDAAMTRSTNIPYGGVMLADFVNNVWTNLAGFNTPTYTLTVNNGTGSGTYASNTVATISGTGLGTFIGWTPNLNISNTNNSTTTMLILSNSVATANYLAPAGLTTLVGTFINVSISLTNTQ